MEIISGSVLARDIRERLREDNQQQNLVPRLVMIVVGDDKESLVYVGLKEKAVKEIGGESELLQLPADTSREELLDQIDALNQDENVDGVLLQLPLPGQLHALEDDFLQAIDIKKDVDGFNPCNRGRLCGGQAEFVSCAALAAMEAIQNVKPDIKGCKAILVGDSFDLILPLAMILVQQGCRVNIIPEFNTPGEDLAADILVAEKGFPGLFHRDNLMPGMVVIDAGFYWTEEGTCGNVNKESVKDMSGCLLPVPGGLGPMLIAKLMENLCLAARLRRIGTDA